MWYFRKNDWLRLREGLEQGKRDDFDTGDAFGEEK